MNTESPNEFNFTWGMALGLEPHSGDVFIPTSVLDTYHQRGISRYEVLCLQHLFIWYNEGKPLRTGEIGTLAKQMGYRHVRSVRILLTSLAEKGLVEAVPTIPPDKLHPGQPCDGRCAYCNESYPMLDTHHVIPRSEGGLDAAENVTYLCPNCHRLAHSLTYLPRWPA